MTDFQTQEATTKLNCTYFGCRITVSNKYNLKRHIEVVHLKLKPYQCLECSRVFVSKQTLSDHVNSHTGEKPFKCHLCGASYKHSSKLSFHRKQHRLAGELPTEETKRVARLPANLYQKYRIVEQVLIEDSYANLRLPLIRNSAEINVKLPLPEALKRSQPDNSI